MLGKLYLAKCPRHSKIKQVYSDNKDNYYINISITKRAEADRLSARGRVFANGLTFKMMVFVTTTLRLRS